VEVSKIKAKATKIMKDPEISEAIMAEILNNA